MGFKFSSRLYHCFVPGGHLTLIHCPTAAEFRGPGVHHNFDDSDSGYDIDSEQKSGKSFGIGGYKGRIIFLGDGTEILTDSDDTEMFDNTEEDKDLESQVSKGSASSSEDESGEGSEGEAKGAQKSSEDSQSQATRADKSGSGSESTAEAKSDEAKGSAAAKEDK